MKNSNDVDAFCKNEDLIKALEYKDELIEYCEMFRKFFGIKKEIYRSIPETEDQDDYSELDVAPFPKMDVAIALIPSFKLLKNQFSKAGICFDGTKRITSEDRRIKKEVRTLDKDKYINNDYYIYLRNYISFLNQAQELNEIMLSYTPQHGLERLKFIVKILGYIDEMWKEKNPIRYDKKIQFIMEIKNFSYGKPLDDRFTDEILMGQALSELSAIAQNIKNCVFPGVYKKEDIAALRSFLRIDSSEINAKKLNSTYKKILPDPTIPFYNILSVRKS